MTETPPDLPDELLSRADEMDDDPSIDFDSNQRHDDGWIKQYVECPECGVPMARTTLESEPVDIEPALDASESVHRAICPQCHKIGARILIRKVTAEYHRLDESYEEINDRSE